MGTLVFVWIGSIVVALIAGQSRGRGLLDSAMFGFALGPVGVLLICLLPVKNEEKSDLRR